MLWLIRVKVFSRNFINYKQLILNYKLQQLITNKYWLYRCTYVVKKVPKTMQHVRRTQGFCHSWAWKQRDDRLQIFLVPVPPSYVAPLPSLEKTTWLKNFYTKFHRSLTALQIIQIFFDICDLSRKQTITFVLHNNIKWTMCNEKAGKIRCSGQTSSKHIIICN